MITSVAPRIPRRHALHFGPVLTPGNLRRRREIEGFGYGTAIVASFVHLKDTFGGSAKFGFIQTLTDQFCYIGVMILPIFFDKFQYLFGTQGAFLLFGGLNFNILVAGVSLRTSDGHRKILGPNLNDVLHDQEQQLQHDDHQEERWSIRLFLCHYWFVLLRNPDIWFLCSISLLHYFNMIGWALFLVSLGEELGYSRSTAVLLSSCGGFGALFGRVWSLILFFHNVHNPFQFFGIPALMQCASFIGIVFTRNMFYLSAIMTFVSGMSFGTTGAATVGVCALKTSNRDFAPALAILFMVCAFGNEIGGGVCGFVYDTYGSNKIVFFVMAMVSFLASLIASLWTMFACYLQD